MSWRSKIGLIGVTWLTAVFRTHGLFANTFHMDEALFASWARLIAVWRDPLLLTQAVDKPPLLFYLQALFYPLQGPVEWAARLPNFIASIIIVPLLGVLAWRWYGDEITAVFAAFFLALSPFAIQFSATAFTDPLMVMWIVAALTVASNNLVWKWTTAGRASSSGRQVAVTRHFIAGILFGLAIATKYQSWLFLPLLIGMGWLAGWRRRVWLCFFVGLGTLMLAVLLWDLVRTGQFLLWRQQMGNFGGVRLSWSWEIWPRLLAWGQMWRFLWVSPMMMVLVVLAVGRPFIGLLTQRRKLVLSDVEVEAKTQSSIDQMLALLILGYVVVHWLLAVPVWDRYLLAMVPWVAILLARLLVIVNGQLLIVKRQWRSRYVFIVAGLLLIVLLLPVSKARVGQYGIGGSPKADGGAAEIANYLYDAPYGTVLYDHWFSWQWGYHFFDRGVYVNWVPHPTMLVEDLTVFSGDDNVRFVVLSDEGAEQPFIREVEAAGFGLEPVPEAGGTKMTLYQIISP